MFGLVLVLADVLVAGLLVTVEVVVVVVDVEVGVDFVLVVGELWQFWLASRLTVAAPWPRFCSKVVLTVEGRLATALLSEVAASAAAPQSCESSAEEIEFS